MAALPAWIRRGAKLPGTEIFKGITYGCERLEPSEEGSGFIHWVRVDLSAPGIELYVTPKDPTAVSQGWEYHLRRIGDVVDTEAPRSCHQRDPVHVKIRLATVIRRPCQRR